MNQSNEYDIVIVGGGPGGYVAAIRAAQLGAKVALVEKERVGGVCLNRGCIPTKALIESLHVLSVARRGAEFGVSCPDVNPDFPRMMKRKEEIVGRLRKGVQGLLKKNKVDVIAGRGKLTDANTMQVTAGPKSQKVNAHNIILAKVN